MEAAATTPSAHASAPRRGGRLLASWRERAIAALVGLHFCLGLAAGIPWRSHVREIPLLGSVLRFYERNHLDQRWSMFSPPPYRYNAIFYSVHFPEGWTELQNLEDFAVQQVRRRIVQPRGAFRLMVHLRSVSADTMPAALTPRSSRAFYFQQLTDHFCRGAGRIPGALAFRFYVVGKTPPHFFERDRFGQPLPPPADSDFVEPLYEQTCAAR